jgi:3-dehydroquinate synthase
MEARRTVHVELGPRSYAIRIGRGVLDEAGPSLVAQGLAHRVFVITHPALWRWHGEALAASLAGVPVEALALPPGERQKSLRRAARLYDELLARGADRSSTVLAFGGGVVGDLAGFVAATFMRGLPYVQVPTTLLAQVDASLGGKVAVDHPRAKNLIGAFHQPRLVLADSEVLRTLSLRDYRAGLAEVVKHGLLEAKLFAWLEASVPQLRARDPEAIGHIVARSCEIKAEVVRQDERELGLRATLNLGHTVGHALETSTTYRRLRHGEAVAIGLVAAVRLSQAVGLCGPELGDRVQTLLEALHLPVRMEGLTAEEVRAALAADKKAVGGVPRFILLRAPGCVETVSDVPPAALFEALRAIGLE